jgi:hypothetical protein
MSAYIYKLISPKKFTWMRVQADKDTTSIRKVYHMEFWYKPFSGMEEDKKLQKQLNREDKKTKALFEGIDVEYAITTYEGNISKPFAHGDYFGCWQVVNWKKCKFQDGRIEEYTLPGRIVFNDESGMNIWHKAVLASKEDVVEELTSCV